MRKLVHLIQQGNGMMCFRATAIVVFLTFLAWLLGGVYFCRMVFQFADERAVVVPAFPEKAGVAALTGGRNRIARGVELLEMGVGSRLLISGVQKGTTFAQIAAREDVHLKEGQAVDLGYQATDTVGNALEIKAWVNEHQLERLAVVTSFYHIPRARLELERFLPALNMRFYAVKTPFVLREWWKSPRSFGFLMAEYTKFLVVYAQYKVLGL